VSTHNHCRRGKATNITYSEWVPVALVINHEKRMRRIILSSLASPAVPYVSTLHNFRKSVIEHKIVI